MAKADLKTKQTTASVEKFLNSIADEQQRADARTVSEMMQRLTGDEPKMWGPSIVGFGSRHLKYDSGRELDWMCIGFSPRKANLSLYVISESLRGTGLLDKLGPHKKGVGCLYIKRLADIDQKVLEKVIKLTLKGMKC